MVRSIFAMVTLFAISTMAHHDPITEFPDGVYLGEGKYSRTTDADEEGTYSSYLDIHGDEWNFVFVRDGNLSSYHLSFAFGDHGFFDVEITEYVSDGQVNVHEGYGYCGQTQCHYAVDLDNRSLEETITFATADNKISKIGSIRYEDANGNEQTTAWEEGLVRIGGNDEGDSDDDDDDDEEGKKDNE